MSLITPRPQDFRETIYSLLKSETFAIDAPAHGAVEGISSARISTSSFFQLLYYKSVKITINNIEEVRAGHMRGRTSQQRKRRGGGGGGRKGDNSYVAGQVFGSAARGGTAGDGGSGVSRRRYTRSRKTGSGGRERETASLPSMHVNPVAGATISQLCLYC